MHSISFDISGQVAVITGAALTTRVFGKLPAKQGHGNVINIAPMSSYWGV